MKKICIFLLMLSFITISTSACSHKPKQNMVQSQRRFAKYVEPMQQGNGDVIDLSEGPKLKYDANFGPTNPGFEFKIVDPY